MRDTTDINQYKNDQHFPKKCVSVSMSCPMWVHTLGVSATTFISLMVRNKGIEKLRLHSVEKDILDEDGDVPLFEWEKHSRTTVACCDQDGAHV